MSTENSSEVGKPFFKASIVNGQTIKVELDNAGTFATIYRNTQLSETVSVNKDFIKNAKQSFFQFKIGRDAEPTSLEKLILVFAVKFCSTMVKTVEVMHTIEFGLLWEINEEVKEYQFNFQRPLAPVKKQFALLYVAEMFQNVIPVAAGEQVDLPGSRLLVNAECMFTYHEVLPKPIEEPKLSRWEAR